MLAKFADRGTVHNVGNVGDVGEQGCCSECWRCWRRWRRWQTGVLFKMLATLANRGTVQNVGDVGDVGEQGYCSECWRRWRTGVLFRKLATLANRGTVQNVGDVGEQGYCSECWRRWRQEPVQVTSPKEIAFTASLSKTITLGSGQAIVYDTIMMNYGNAYNNNSGHFTAPVSGIYLASAGIVAEPGKRVAIDLFLNSKFMYVTMYVDARSIRPYAYSSKTFPIFLRQGDNIWFQGRLGYEGSSVYGFPNYLHTYFAGVLLNQI
ncbi:unnamed protein product [Mytilus coruscus]|uniref:C1q domain-containing protein n=1 Tax=Mytilus coruscus TaxID=42192 RepID=A0A6J8B9V3_MYTCO|nr:unnamed protein product [Mytilus coruscus]